MFDFSKMREAHICDIWALLIIFGSVVVILSLMILQIKCKTGMSKCVRERGGEFLIEVEDGGFYDE